MGQVMRGSILGSPGPVGSPAICDLFGSGSPLTSTDPNVSGAQVGSSYRDYVNGALWFKTLNGWQQVTIP
jgi:hypothetical protein